MSLLSYITKNTNLPEVSVKNTISLLNDACTVPFISRYRKEATGNLDEVEIGDIVKYKELFEALEKRKTAILKALEEQDVLTSELEQKINDAQDITTLEDIYLPYKKSRKTKADTAKANGLEPLAKIIMSQNAHDIESIAYKYVKDAVGMFVLAGSETPNVTKIDTRTPNTIERTSNQNKLYQKDNIVQLTFHNNDSHTVLYTIDLNQLDLKVKTYPYPKSRLNNNFKKEIKYNTAEDMFYINDTLYFGYFNLKESIYNLVKF